LLPLRGRQPRDERDSGKGRPVGLAIDKRGALLVADDVGNAVWRVAARQ
jgi:glucose/arabinose dehydrogenase